jgi:hypothetical protein
MQGNLKIIKKKFFKILTSNHFQQITILFNAPEDQEPFIVPISDDDCHLLAKCSNEFPEPLKTQEMAGKSKPGTFLDINVDLEREKFESAGPETGLQKSGKMEETGLSEAEEIGIKLLSDPETRTVPKTTNPPSTEPTRNSSSNRVMKCDRCGKEFRQKRYLITHIQAHNTTNNFNCRICKQAFKTEYARGKHEKRHVAPKVSCEICKKEYKHRFALKRHNLDVHSNKEKSNCQICKKVFGSKRTLRRHNKRIHFLNGE